jgi:2-polyprenyl-3-methyl-5-hydroxy-6-metoxy-1,4-benzoquinol methylase
MDSVKYYDSIANSYEALYRREQEAKIRTAISLVKPRNSDRILDVGAGSGITEEMLPGFHITALEPSNLIDLLVRKAKKGVTPVKEEFLGWDSKGAFDVIFCITVLQDLKENDRDQFLRKIFDICKPGGKIAISVLTRSGIKLDYRNPLIVREVENDVLYIFKKA